jgi:hypothetical protein
VTALALAVTISSGCSRRYYRTQADQDAMCLVNEKSGDPRWGLPGFNLSTDPRSRYFDPTDPDHPPIPQDDPASHVFMHCIAGMKHFKGWHADGNAASLENPCWLQELGGYVDLTPEGKVILSLPSSLVLASMHEQDFRAQLETVFLSALDVSTERFRLETQFFAGNTTAFLHKGKDVPPTGETNTLTTINTSSMQRHFSTGADLLVSFANTFVWQFAGPDTNSAFSLLSFNLVQPLLRAGGKAVALEQLTIVERALLANLRAFERYREGFFTNLAIGDGGTGPLQRRGGFFGGTGLTGFTGQGAAGFGGVGQATFGNVQQGANGANVGAVGTGFAGGGAGAVGGFLGLLQQLQQVRNTEDNLNAESRTLGLLEANLDAGLIDIAQVDQFRQSIETERANLLQAKTNLQNTMDTYLVGSLGLPPDLEVDLDDEFIRQFQFIAPQTVRLQSRIEDFVATVADKALPRENLGADGQLAELRTLGEDYLHVVSDVDRDLVHLREMIPRRLATLPVADKPRFDMDQKQLAESLAELKAQDERLLKQLDPVTMPGAPPGRSRIDQIVAAGKSLSGLCQELSLVQARARLESVTVEPINISPERAFEISRANRLDWMNNRAALVDTWRLIVFNANALKSNVTIGLSGTLGTHENNAFDFRGTNGTLKGTLQFDAPLTRLLERNNYRSVLISYQQGRRQLMQYQDTNYATLRRLLRVLTQQKENMEIQRRAVVIAVRRVDQTREVLNRPPDVVQPGQPAAQLGPTAAQNLLTALSDLRNSQNNFMSVWLNYYATRMLLYRELGVMHLDERGYWNDQPLEQALGYSESECPLPPEVPADWMRDAGVKPEEIQSPSPATEASPAPGRVNSHKVLPDDVPPVVIRGLVEQTTVRRAGATASTATANQETKPIPTTIAR